MSSVSPTRTARSIGWLWLTDLHFGQKDQRWLWPNFRADFLEDIDRIHPRCGPWDAVVFTGDLVFSGKADDFDSLTPVLRKVLDRISNLQGYTPVFVSVPGNHDIIRPGASSTMVALGHWWDEPRVRDEFWNNSASEYRRVVSEAHLSYSRWATLHGFAPAAEYQAGLLPGDFSAVIAKDDVRLEVVGLNSTFLQLAGGEFAGKLDLDPRQLVEACSGDHVDWLAANNASVLLTHQPPAWLHPSARENYEGVIYNPNNFIAHFYGHMHESSASETSPGMGTSRRQIQGCSLYGLEHYGEAFENQRLNFGYAAVRFEFEGDHGQLILWPRKAVRKQGGYWGLGPDVGYQLVDDQQTTPSEFPLKIRCETRSAIAIPDASRLSTSARPACVDSNSRALYVLQQCPDRLPGQVLGSAVRLTPSELRKSLGPFVDTAALRERDEFKLTVSAGPLTTPPDAEDLHARTLELLNGYIDQHKSDGLGARYVDAAISLARKCKGSSPKRVGEFPPFFQLEIYIRGFSEA